MKIRFARFVFIIFCVLHPFFAISQEISGSVFDENKKPMQGVSIYLDGTTTGTSTDVNGEFSIKSQKISTSLVISYVGYETVYLSDPFQNKNQKFYLTVKNESLKEIVIRKELFSRNQKMKIFRAYFLGRTKAGKLCKIINEDDIDFDYDYDKNTLTATSKNPVKIVNSYLGYDVNFDIYKFNIFFNSKSISEHNVVKSMFLGTTLYKTTSESDVFIKRRKNVFYGSAAHFYRNLTKGIWDKKNFLLFKGSSVTRANEHFLVTKETNLYKVTVLKNDLSKIVMDNKNFKANFNLLYNKKEQSRVIFSTNTFFVDDFGNNTDGENIEFGGALSESKLGDLLPINYEP